MTNISLDDLHDAVSAITDPSVTAAPEGHAPTLVGLFFEFGTGDEALTAMLVREAYRDADGLVWFGPSQPVRPGNRN